MQTVGVKAAPPSAALNLFVRHIPVAVFASHMPTKHEAKRMGASTRGRFTNKS
ncbi:hypothetical protein BH11ARM2_BH11ARM2_16320 [soil metagenome]